AYWHTHRVPVLITRSSNNFGPYQYPEKVIPLFVTNALDDTSLPLYGDGRNVRDWLYVLDNCAGIDLVLRKGADGEVYNIGGGPAGRGAPLNWRGPMKRVVMLALATLLLAPTVAPGAPTSAPERRLNPGEVSSLPSFVRRVEPAIVGLRVRNFESAASSARLGSRRFGSGVIFDARGYVLTVSS